MVGAAGFEPATWSTQNSRATRLRYAPKLRVRYTLRFSPASSELPPPLRSAPAEDRMRNAVPRDYAQFTGCAGDDFEHRAHRAIRGDARFRKRDRVLGD